ncbi:hypothetical protein [Nostoc sp. JL33]|uniref:hypothetical protein n=1 Tax=Nostoc sp. JL33 TaxID=2815396 RepID=UPI0025FB0187|nr:hypothetical protein [Nostoc sp. JL33]MBN3870542.1 hypothetical protein [Nostoc sp. JL33]
MPAAGFAYALSSFGDAFSTRRYANAYAFFNEPLQAQRTENQKRRGDRTVEFWRSLF